jgi:hypothetical protein
MAHPRHEEVRQRYHGRCGYCGVSEADTGGELTVDHFQPVTADGDDSDNNLVYSCFRCNTYKGDFFPSAEDNQAGRRLLHPLLDPISLHLRENEETSEIEALPSNGQFHVLLLRLNRPQLVEHRRRRRIAQFLVERCQLLQDENKTLRQRLALLEGYGDHLRARQREEGPGEHGGQPPA